ncbi:unnamed protein product [Linum trigynum]|uniref:Uncharacterized protein n=1 Tax=Linum trigynum TaxID=586398 RepID=A0AAV2FLV4_9ROSI
MSRFEGEKWSGGTMPIWHSQLVVVILARLHLAWREKMPIQGLELETLSTKELLLNVVRVMSGVSLSVEPSDRWV